MIQFQCDYNEGAHPLILQRLAETNMEQTIGYGEDHYCDEARALIRKACQRDDAAIPHAHPWGTPMLLTGATRPRKSLITRSQASP